MDRKIFNTKDQVIGVNYPPFHINCRSTTKAYFEFLEEDDNKTILKEEKTLKTPKMSYKEWEEKYINKYKDIVGSVKLNDNVYKAIKKEFKGLKSREIILRTERLEHIKFRHPEVVDLVKENYKKIIEDPDYILKDSKYENTVWNIKKLKIKT